MNSVKGRPVGRLITHIPVPTSKIPFTLESHVQLYFLHIISNCGELTANAAASHLYIHSLMKAHSAKPGGFFKSRMLITEWHMKQ